jgi:colanic acid/amylovoran biosynthesis glycosyltransferase
MSFSFKLGKPQRSEGRTRPQRSVVMVTTTFPAKPGDGTPEFVLTLARSLTDHAVTVVAPRVPDAARRENIDGVEVRRVAYFPARWEGLAADAIMPRLRAQPWRVVEVPFLFGALLIATWTTVRRVRPAAVNPHWIMPSGIVATLVGTLTRTPYVVTVHGADAYTLTSRVARRLKRGVLGRAAAVLPVSEDIARTLELTGNTPVLRMGVDAEAVREQVGVRTPEPGLLVSIGRLADKKGLDVLLQAMVNVPNVRLEVIGDGPEGDNLRTQACDLGIADRVRFAGRQPREVVLDALKRAQAVVIPSKVGAGGDRDGTPVVLCEAMAAGVPVVASALGGLQECLDDGYTGLLVPPDDADALTDALRMVADGAVDLSTMGKAAAVEAERSLDINTIGRSYDRILTQVSQ